MTHSTIAQGEQLPFPGMQKTSSANTYNHVITYLIIKIFISDYHAMECARH